MRKKYFLGKCDYNGSKRKNCKAFITWELKDGNFSMCAEIWNPRETDIYMGGQCVEEVAAFFKGSRVVRSMVAIWEKWHLNDMRAGCEHQTKWKWTHKTHPSTKCPICHYRYGSAWLKEELPADIVKIIESWPTS